jgi:hypothetical protein
MEVYTAVQSLCIVGIVTGIVFVLVTLALAFVRIMRGNK